MYILMLYNDRTDASEGIDLNNTDESKECSSSHHMSAVGFMIH